jgi:hypothetical protein
MTNSLATLRLLNGELKFLQAASLLKTFGHAKGLMRNPKTNALSCAAAIYVACGAPIKKVNGITDDAESCCVPERTSALAEELILFFESTVGTDDIHEWNDKVNASKCIKAFRSAAKRLAIVGSQ